MVLRAGPRALHRVRFSWEQGLGALEIDKEGRGIGLTTDGQLDGWPPNGISAGNLAFYVRVYSNTIKHLRKREQESLRAAVAFAQLREHLAAQAAMLLKSVTPEELSQIHLDDLDESISERSDSYSEAPDVARDKLAAEAYQTLANLEAAMENLTGQGKARPKSKKKKIHDHDRKYHQAR